MVMPRLNTAGGIVKPEDAKISHIAELEETVEFVELESADAPNVLALGKCCAMYGYDFHWKPYADRPDVTLPSGVLLQDVEVENWVPFIWSLVQAPGPEVVNEQAPAASAPRYVRAMLVHGTSEAVLDEKPEDFGDFCIVPGDLSQIDVVEELPDWTPLADLRIVRGEEKLTFDEEAKDNVEDLKFVELDDDTLELSLTKTSKLDINHLAHHLKKLSNCPICAKGKQAKTPSRRRPDRGVTVIAQDAIDQPFGAMAHTDFIIMKHGSIAARSCKCGLIITDEKTSFIAFYPCHHHDADAVVDSSHLFEGDQEVVRRWWTDCTPEFAAASRRIRSLRPLSHFTSVPHRHQANGIAERSNRTVIEGGRCLLIQAALPTSEWTVACTFFATMRNVFYVDNDGTKVWKEPNVPVISFRSISILPTNRFCSISDSGRLTRGSWLKT